MTSAAQHSLLRVLALALVALTPAVVGLPASAQTGLASDPGVDTGTHSYGTYDGVHENISLSSGNVSFCIPLVSLKGPNKHDLTAPLCYNSQFQEAWPVGGVPVVNDIIPYFPWVWASNTPSGYTTPAMGVGWTFSGAPAFYMSSSGSPSGGAPVWFMPDGAKYNFPTYSQGEAQGPDFQAADLWSWSGSGPMLTKDGTQFTLNSGASCPPMGCAAEQFPDGTKISWTNSSITDAVGRTVTVQTAGSGFSGSTKTSSAASIAVQYPDSSGTLRTVTVEMQTMQFSCTSNGIGPTGSGGGPYSMPTAIILPDGPTYTFQYDSCGMLRKVTFPTGGYTRYDYEAVPMELGYNQGSIFTYYMNEVIAKHVCPAPAVTLGATSAPSGNNCPVAEETTTYTPTAYQSTNGNANSQNIVVDPVGNSTIYQFSTPNSNMSWPAVETSRQMYDASGKLWKTITTQYSSTTAPGSNSTVGLGDYPDLPTIQTTTLDNGMVSQIQWSYNFQNLYSNDSVLTEERVYDYGSGAPGALVKRTDYDWLHRDNPAYYGWPSPGNDPSGGGQHICDRKTSETVYDGSGKTLAQTKYVYDYGSPTTYGAKGLLTSVQNWRNTDGAWLTTSYQYGSYGNVTQKTDPNNNVTNYSYNDNYADGINRNSGAFLTKTIDPLGHVSQNQYYWGSGLVAASCGENFSGTCATGLTSGADYASYTYDLMGRKISATTGDGGQTTSCFSELGGSGCSAQGYPLQVTSTEAVASGVTKTSAVILDGGGKNTRSELLSDPSCPGGTVNVDTTYDLDERKSTVTNPYCSTNQGAPTSGTTTYAYDGLSRVTQVTHPDNTYATNTYTGRAVLSADEGNGTDRIQRISQTDALGRLIYACEVTGQTQQGSSNNTPSSCSLDVSGSGFLTTYGYDASNSNGPLESLTSVIQGGVDRSFIYDSLGELQSASNPESGTTTYLYDNDGNLISKTSPLENQQSGTVTTTYTYDQLNRLLSKSYSDGITASACFEYDQNPSGNGVGRLTTEWTQTGTCSSTPPNSGTLTQRTFAGYDPLGRVTADEQCITLGNCGSGVYTINYGYDLAGDVTSFNNGLSGNTYLSFTGQYNSAGRLSTVNGSSTPGGQSMSLFTATAYTPAGALSNAEIGPTVGENITFQRSYNSRLLPTAETDTQGTSPGTATLQITGTEQFSAYSMGTVTFSGSEQCPSGGCDYGTFLVFIKGGAPVADVMYGQYDTPQSLALALANQLTCANGGLVQGYATGPTVYLVSCTTGSNTNYSLSTELAGFRYEGQYSPSFSATTSGSALTPITSTTTIPGTSAYVNPNASAVTFYGAEQSGQNGGMVFFVFSGWVNNGAPVQTFTINWGSSSTTATLASALAADFPACSPSNTIATASVYSGTDSGPTVVLSPCQTGSTYAIEAEIEGYSGGSGPSFIPLTNGSTASSAPVTIPVGTADSGTAALTVNGTQIATTNYGSTSTPSSIASALASAGSGYDGLVTVSASGANLTMTALGDGTTGDYSYQVTFSHSFTNASFAASPSSGSLTGGTNVPLYNWAINTYAPNGDVLSMTDSVMGTWSYSYDDFNRLTSGAASAGVDNTLSLSWTYDRYGNRWAQNASGTGNISAVQPQLSFGNTNQVAGWSYDADGNLLNDGRNSYAYDAEGRIVSLNGQPTYLYDAEGRRVAKYSGSTITAIYLLDLGGHQVTELNASGAWMHSNVWAGDRLLATYEGSGESKPNTWHFHLTDWLGTQRMQTNAAGTNEEVCYSYPFGDGLTCTGSDATEHHFTSKERDVESGLDYFYARYYTSDLARFMTPDWAAAPTAVPYATFGDPQTLNLYVYVNNNPNTGIDLGGHEQSMNGGDNMGSYEGLLNGGDYTAGDPPSSIQELDASLGFTPTTTSPSGSTTDSGQQKGDAPRASNPDPKNPVGQQAQPGQNSTSTNSGSGDSNSTTTTTTTTTANNAPMNATVEAPPLPTVEAQPAPKVEAQPAPSAPTQTPKRDLLGKIFAYIGCAAGMDPENATPITQTSKPQDPLQSTAETEGRGGEPAGLSALQLGESITQCIQNVNKMWSQK
ncbi:MAG: RHS repeat-associated core domain-containing protein [Terracidiphilus sp.]